MSGRIKENVKKSQDELTGKLLSTGYKFLTHPEEQDTIIGKLKNLTADAKTLWLMVKDYLAGEYTAIPKSSIAIAAGALIYFAAPDLPGPIDDALIVAAAVAALGQDLKDYKDWKRLNEKALELTLELETGRKITVAGDSIPLHISERIKEIAEEGKANERAPESDTE